MPYIYAAGVPAVLFNVPGFMSFVNTFVKVFTSHRRSEIDRFRVDPVRVQEEQLKYLLDHGRATEYGKSNDMASIRSVEQFQQRLDIYDYEAFSPYILRAKAGERNVLWPGRVKWFAKSSGTTGSKSKYIPVTDQGLKKVHLQGPRDVIAIFAALYPENKAFSGKTLTLGGSSRVECEGESALTGDLSAIMISNTPSILEAFKAPSTETALIADFDEKVRRICEETVGQNITAFAGVPSWNLVMLNRVLEYTGKSNILEVWPNMEMFVHGGMNFSPYRELYKKIIPSDSMKYMETYNASEGFFGIGDDPSRDDMLLMLDYGQFYEFLPTEHLGDPSKAVTLADVKTGVNYALIVSSCNGLWRYMIGDTVTFTSVSPYRLRITGRTRHFINAFGEEVMVENAERALRAANDATGAEVAEFTAGPVFMDSGSKGAHEWVIEFAREPDSMERFAQVLDLTLQQVNSDYEAKRFKNTTLNPPRISVVPHGTFLRWMEMRGRKGGQNKVPRLYNDRTYVDELLGLREPV